MRVSSPLPLYESGIIVGPVDVVVEAVGDAGGRAAPVRDVPDEI